MAGNGGNCSRCGKQLSSDEAGKICSSCLELLQAAFDDATLNLWEQSLSPGMTAEDSIRSAGWERQAESLPIPRSRSLTEAKTKQNGSADFEIREKLGAGGMGVVYTAHQTSINREVALKMVRPEHADSKSASEALMSEAVITGALDHPNVVPVYDLGVDEEGRLFYAMKEVEGFPWSSLIGEKTLDENLDILLRVADTIAFAHSKGILHRDLKPQNIMLGSFGEIMVMDWGAACTLSGSNVAGMLPTDTAYCGTPAYMAPEMAKADKNRLGEASDVYLLGATLYHILTGRPPRCEQDPLICLAAAARNHIDPIKEDSELFRVALKAMADAPADRYETVEGFQQALRDYRSHSESRTLLAKAKENLNQAKANSDYDLFNRAIYGFREALDLWANNPDAQALMDNAQVDYARCAMDQHDYELALSQLEAENPQHAPLIQEINTAIKERDARKNRVRRLLVTARVLLAVITILSIAGFFMIRSEQQQTEIQRQKATSEHWKSLNHLVSAHYGNQNYEAAVSSFWNLVDLYGTNGLPDQTLLEARISSAMNPYKGWLGPTNGTAQTLRVGDYELKRPAVIAREEPGHHDAGLQDGFDQLPIDLRMRKPVAFCFMPDGARYSLVTEEGALICGSIEPGGFYLEQQIEKRDIVKCSLSDDGLTALHERNGTVHLYDMNAYATRELPMPGKAMGVCAGVGESSFYGLVQAGGQLGVFDVPVWKQWDAPYQRLATVDKGSNPCWEDFAHSVEEGVHTPLRIGRVFGAIELVLKADGLPLFDSRFFPDHVKNLALSIDGTKLAVVDADGRFLLMNLSSHVQDSSMKLTPVHYVSKQGKNEWPFQTLETAATNLQQVLETVSGGDTVLVDDGIYEAEEEDIITAINGLTIKSMNGSGSCTLIQQGKGRSIKIQNLSGPVTVRGFTFQGLENAGGLELFGCNNASVSDCRFVGNRSEDSGGGLQIVSKRDKASHVQVVDCLFSNNSAKTKGGGLSVVQQSGQSSQLISNCVFSANTSQRSGGGAYLQPMGSLGDVTLSGNRFDGNRAVGPNGSGGGLNITFVSQKGDIRINGNHFKDNSAGHAGGGGVSVAHRGIAGNVFIEDCECSGNYARLAGGGMLVDGSFVNTEIRESTFSNNDALSGGGLHANSIYGTVTIDRCRIRQNHAISYGGGISGNRIFPQFRTNIVISNSWITDNRSDYQGGGVRDRVLENCIVTGNQAALGGGVSFCILKGCTVEDNSAQQHADLYNSLVIPADGDEETLFQSFTNNPAFYRVDEVERKATHQTPPGYESTP